MKKCWVSGIVAVCLLRNQKHIVCTYSALDQFTQVRAFGITIRFSIFSSFSADFSFIFRLFFPFPPHSFRRSVHAWTCQFLRLDFGCEYCRSARVRARERRRVRKVEGSQSQLVLLLPHYWIRWKWNEKIKFTFLTIHGLHILTQCQHQGDLEIG